MTRKLLLVFVKNPRLGAVKTGLAASIGDQKALRVYQLLLDHTLRIASRMDMDKAVYYSDFIPASDAWRKNGFQQFLQTGSDLGERMSNAFRNAFIRGYDEVVLIGSDCYELEIHHLTSAFESLLKKQVVLGPATDGGYYLIGMNAHYPTLFQQKNWSTSSVFAETLESLKQAQLTWDELEQRSDIDDLNDLMQHDDLFLIL